MFSWFFLVNILVMSMWCQNITYKYDGWSQKLVSVSYFKMRFLLHREAKTQLKNTMSEKKILHFQCTYLLGHLDMAFMCVGSKLDIIVGARGFFIRGQKKSIGPMYEEKILGNTPKIPIASFSFSLLKVGIP